MKNCRKYLYRIIPIMAVLILAVVEWKMHCDIEFMMDDLWYSTNLATDEPLRSFWDVIQSQVWHFLNWGGRCVTHGILQLTLMSGELAADIFNVAMTLLLSYLICVISGEKKPLWFLTAFSMLIALNANWKMSMFWQAGAVNYVYSAAWILVFLLPYVRQLEKKDSRALPLINLWIVPIGIMTGWSNENMGPACFVVAIAVILYLKKWEKRNIPIWMPLGAVCAGIGSVLVVAAPGNFVRSAAIQENGGVTIGERLYSMLRAGVDFLFPTLGIMVLVLLVYGVCLKGKLRPVHWMLLATGVLSYGAMILSPHYPDRATFGTMVVGIIVIISVLAECVRKQERMRAFAVALAGCSWGYAVYALVYYAYCSTGI